MNKKVLWILMLSLAANVFFGVVVGTQFSRGPKGAPPRPERLLDEMAEILPPADARILRDAVDARRNDLAEPPDAPFRQHERMRQVLLAEPFDAEAFRGITSEFHARRERVGKVIGEVLTETLPKMSPEARKRLAEFRPPPPR